MVYGHIEEAFTAITQKYSHFEDAKLEMFIESPRVRTMFARVVTMCIRISDVLSGWIEKIPRSYGLTLHAETYKQQLNLLSSLID